MAACDESVRGRTRNGESAMAWLGKWLRRVTMMNVDVIEEEQDE